VGKRIDLRINELLADLPIGINVERISWQSDQVSESIRAFMVSLIEAVAIVLALLAITMGIRPGIIIGISGLVFPILGTFIVMAIWGIDLHRISLGALIIAMGMMVDNAIVVTDGIMVRIASGMDRKQAAIEAANGPAMPLSGATVVACMAFFPIFASSYDTGEYAGSLFTVVAISLLLSWVFCQTVGPILCIAMLPGPKEGQAAIEPYQGKLYQLFRKLLSLTIRFRLLFLGSMVGLLFLSVVGFRWVPQLYFPDSSRLQVMIDYWAPEGTRIQQTNADLQRIEEFVQQHDATVSVSAFIGKGPPRFDAGRRPRGFDLHGRHAGRILPPDGFERAVDRRLDFSLGSSHARDFRPHGRDSGRGSISCLPRFIDQKRVRTSRHDSLSRRVARQSHDDRHRVARRRQF
jgi:multidrug efflux pump subunit AcrB